jgi:telomere length regulation protein
LILLFLSYREDEGELAKKVGCNQSFITSIGNYISHLEKSIRLCGLLVAEVVAERSGKQLSFGVWDGGERGQLWAKATKKLLATSLRADPNPGVIRPSEQNESSTSSGDVGDGGGDSDDSQTGYESEVNSEASSPSPTELTAMEKDATLRSGLKTKVIRPVFISQLLSYLRASSASDNEESAEKVEIALKSCEDLIRRKKDYGTELC